MHQLCTQYQYQINLQSINMGFLIVFCITIVLLQITLYSTACGGYNLKVDHFRNCGDYNTVLLSKDFRPVLNNDCTVTLIGCTIITKTFDSAQINYNVTHNGIKHSRSMNACHSLEGMNFEMSSIMNMFGVPKSCPVPQSKICGHGKQVSLRWHRLKLSVVSGITKGRAELRTNVGNSCFEFSFSLKRNIRFK